MPSKLTILNQCKLLKEENLFLPDGIPFLDFFGKEDQNLKFLRKKYSEVKIVARDNHLKIEGNPLRVSDLKTRLHLLMKYVKQQPLTIHRIEQVLDLPLEEAQNSEVETGFEVSILHTHHRGIIKPKNAHQIKLLEAHQKSDLLFAIGAAGTGKTYLAVALAVAALKRKEIKRIIITRPAVEAGENLGFLPGDLKEKLTPYLQPIYDALLDMISPEKLKDYLENKIIQIAPLAFMRGRTLSNAYVILDEAQNATSSQMKMFLTRMGSHTKFFITGDPNQKDLSPKIKSGLTEAIERLEQVKGVEIIRFDTQDVLRHPLVKKIIQAYEND